MDGFPMTELAACAAQVHELFTELWDAGFTREEAFELTKIVVEAQESRG